MNGLCDGAQIASSLSHNSTCVFCVYGNNDVLDYSTHCAFKRQVKARESNWFEFSLYKVILLRMNTDCTLTYVNVIDRTRQVQKDILKPLTTCRLPISILMLSVVLSALHCYGENVNNFETEKMVCDFTEGAKLI